SLVQRQGRLTEAIDLLERASATDPDDHNYPLALGVLILEQGNPRVGDGSAKDPPSSRVELALPYFQTALQTSHNDTRVAMKIAQILSGTDLKAAKAFLRTADLTVRNAVEPDSA
ncbi:MAG: hypothetical protein NTU41_00905, partial [Chloroflexi bacterium]|nr:hypothetical protein [Chloroflexota bacterium]